jgi:hypothetical protein
VLYFALPCMLFRFGMSTPVAQLLDPAAVAVYLPCALLMVAATVRFSLNERVRWNDASFGALVAAFPNTGFMGVPLLVALLGAGAAGPAILTILLDLVITTSLCIALSRLDGADEHGAAKAAKSPQGRGRQPHALGHPGRRGRVVAAAGAHQAGDADHRAAGRCGVAGGAVHHRRGAGALADRGGARGPWPHAGA